LRILRLFAAVSTLTPETLSYVTIGTRAAKTIANISKKSL
jgi:hypothetical protein